MFLGRIAGSNHRLLELPLRPNTQRQPVSAHHHLQQPGYYQPRLRLGLLPVERLVLSGRIDCGYAELHMHGRPDAQWWNLFLDRIAGVDNHVVRLSCWLVTERHHLLSEHTKLRACDGDTFVP